MEDKKICRKCSVEKTADEFYVKRLKDRTVLQTDCIKCTKSYHKQHYRDNKDKYLINTRKNKKIAYDLVNKLKDKPCLDCGGKFPPEAMDFDHVDDNKEYSIALLVSMNSMKKALAEIEKCELVCANCHRTRTKNRRTVDRVVR